MAVRAIRQQVFPVAFGFACLFALVILIELMIKAGWINRFIVPFPSEIAKSFERIILEEDVFSRFLLTSGEALAASVMLTVFGVGIEIGRAHV